VEPPIKKIEPRADSLPDPSSARTEFKIPAEFQKH